MTLRLAIPNKGRLFDTTIDLLCKSGLIAGEDWGRKLFVTSEQLDMVVLFIRVQDIPRLVESGAIDIGITGRDHFVNSGADLKELSGLGYGRCRLSIAAPETSGIKSVEDIKDGCRIATSYPLATRKFFDSRNVDVKIIDISGAAEIMPMLGVSDAISDLVSTGVTLKVNRLVEICTIMESEAVIITNEKSFKKSKDTIMEIVNSINSVIDAASKKYLLADVPVDKLDLISKMFPGFAGLTVLRISGRDDVVAIQVVIDEKDTFKALNELKKIGAEGILTMDIDRLVR